MGDIEHIEPLVHLTDDNGVSLGTATNPIRNDPTGTTPQPVTGTVAVTGNIAQETGGNLAATASATAAAAASLSVVDDWDESDRAKANIIVGQAGVQGGSGVVTGNTQRVTLATDAALPAGTNAIGKVTQDTASNFNAQVVGATAHDAADAGNPIKVGGRAVATAATPTSVATGDRTDQLMTRYGAALIAGHPNNTLVSNDYTAAQSAAVLQAISAGTRAVIKSVEITLGAGSDPATPVYISVEVKIGSLRLAKHPGLAPSSGLVVTFQGVAGADGDDITVTCDDPDGTLSVSVEYHTEAV